MKTTYTFFYIFFAIMFLSSCKSSGSRDWYRGPSERKSDIRSSYDIAMANLKELYPSIAWKDVGFRNLRLDHYIKDPDVMRGGKPHFRMADGTLSRGYMVTHITNRHYYIVEPRGETDYRTLYIHEWGHIIANATGIEGDHHSRFKKFFLERFREWNLGNELDELDELDDSIDEIYMYVYDIEKSTCSRMTIESKPED